MNKLNCIPEWEEIMSQFDAYSKMSCKPTFQKVKPDHVFDEDKSVKWNREKAIEINTMYEEQVAELNRKKNAERDRIQDLIYLRIMDDVGYGLTKESAKAIWNKAWEDGHPFGFRECIIHAEGLIELVSNILKNESKK